MNGDQVQTLSRIDAAAYLTAKGLSIGVSTLAKYASEGKGPAFNKSTNGRHTTTYKVTDLDAWAAQGIHKRRNKNLGGRPRKAPDDLIAALEEFIPLVERVVLGKATFADGVLFERSLATTKAAMSQRRKKS